MRLGTATNTYSAPALPYVGIKGMGLGNAGNPIGANPIGTIQPYPGSTAPSGWMICDGASLSISSYRDLYNALGGSGSPYGSNDGFSSTFMIPDLTGKFVRGVGGNSGSLGIPQNDDIKSHTHQISGKTAARNTSGGGFNVNQVYIGAYTPNDALSTSSASGGTETRPINVAMNYIIYVGGGSVGISDLSGAFVNESSESRLYLYNGIGNLSVASIPSGSGTVSHLHGNFSYFTTSSTKYSGTPAPSPSPTPGPTPGPGPTPAPASACDLAPTITSLSAVGGDLNIYFTLANGGASATSLTLESSIDNSTFTPSTVGTTSPITITEPLVTTYYRLTANCSGSPATSPTSSVSTYTVSAPPSSTKTGRVIVSLSGDKFRVNLDQPATCTYTFALTGTWVDWDTSASGNWNSAPFQINAGSSVSSPIWVDCINNNFPYTDLYSLSGGSPNYNTQVTGGLTSSQCSGTVTLILTQ